MSFVRHSFLSFLKFIFPKQWTPRRLSIKSAIKLKIHFYIKRLLQLSYRESYSQLGEDIAIKHILDGLGVNKGTYIDVGCNHPQIFSNSFNLYLQGWKGITIDLNEFLIYLHQSERKDDTQIHAAISDNVNYVTIYEFESDLISTIDEKFYSEIKKEYKLKSELKKIKTQTLNQILGDLNVIEIDLLLIDVEGHDLNVLKSINLDLYRPKLIIVEVHNFDFENIKANELISYLDIKGYKMHGYLIANGYFIDKNIKH